MNGRLTSVLLNVAVGNAMRLHDLILKLFGVFFRCEGSDHNHQIDVFEVDDIAIFNNLSGWNFYLGEQFVELRSYWAF